MGSREFACLPGIERSLSAYSRFSLLPGQLGKVLRNAGVVDERMTHVDIKLERHREFVFHQTGRDEDALCIAKIEVTVANGVIAQRHVITVGDYRFVSLRHRKRHKVVRLATERRGDGGGHSGDHAIEISLRDRDFTGARVADAIWRLGNRTVLNDFRRTAGDRGGGLRHGCIVAYRTACKCLGPPPTQSNSCHPERRVPCPKGAALGVEGPLLHPDSWKPAKRPTKVLYPAKRTPPKNWNGVGVLR